MIVRNIFPQPFSVAPAEGELRLSARSVLRFNAPFSEGMIAEYKGMWHRFGLRQAELDMIFDPALNENCAVLNAEATCCPALNEGDEYALHVTGEGAFLRGDSPIALYHALLTLVQLIVPTRVQDGFEAALPAVVIGDHPTITNMRAIHLCVFPETTLLLLEKAIRLAGLMKFTHVVLEFWGTLKYDALKELSWPEQSYTKDQIRPLIKLIRDLGMEVIPMINHLGHASQSRSCILLR